jgi:hypothetical protein
MFISGKEALKAIEKVKPATLYAYNVACIASPQPTTLLL